MISTTSEDRFAQASDTIYSMEFLKSDKGYVVRLEKGERLVEKLTGFCKENNIHSGIFNGIGAVLGAEIGFYNLDKKEYEFKKFDQNLELASLIGNVSLVDQEPYLHIHVVVSDSNLACYGGHLKEATVGATCEIYLDDHGIGISRKYDEEIGLKLLNCDQV